MGHGSQWVGNRVVHSSHFQAIFSTFFISFLISFFKNKPQNEMRMNIKMDHFWKIKPFLHFCKNYHFHFHFHVPFLSFFQTPLQHLFFLVTTTINNDAPLPHTSTTTTTNPSPPTVTTPTSTLMPARTVSGHKLSISDGMWAQTMATHHLGSRVLFFVCFFFL